MKDRLQRIVGQCARCWEQTSSSVPCRVLVVCPVLFLVVAVRLQSSCELVGSEQTGGRGYRCRRRLLTVVQWPSQAIKRKRLAVRVERDEGARGSGIKGSLRLLDGAGVHLVTGRRRRRSKRRWDQVESGEDGRWPGVRGSVGWLRVRWAIGWACRSGNETRTRVRTARGMDGGSDEGIEVVQARTPYAINWAVETVLASLSEGTIHR